MWEPKASKALWERAGFAAGSHRDSTFHRSSPPQFSRALSILASHSRAGSSSSRLGEAIGGGSLLLDQSPVWWVLFTLSKSVSQTAHDNRREAAWTSPARLPGSHDVFVKGTHALVGSFVFFWVAPAVVAGVGPFALVGWTMQPPLLWLPGVRVVGVAAVAAGLDCFARFALEGRSTPAPVAQTEVLVASGLYRFVRNLMYVSLLIIVSGQALLFSQARLFAYAGVMLVAFHLFVLFYEEPTLRRRFGGSYETYYLHVGRW